MRYCEGGAGGSSQQQGGGVEKGPGSVRKQPNLTVRTGIKKGAPRREQKPPAVWRKKAIEIKPLDYYKKKFKAGGGGQGSEESDNDEIDGYSEPLRAVRSANSSAKPPWLSPPTSPSERSIRSQGAAQNAAHRARLRAEEVADRERQLEKRGWVSGGCGQPRRG